MREKQNHYTFEDFEVPNRDRLDEWQTFVWAKRIGIFASIIFGLLITMTILRWIFDMVIWIVLSL